MMQVVKSSNFNTVGMIPISNYLQVKDKVKVYRNELLKKYNDGEFLSSKEIKFLATTSELLNDNYGFFYILKGVLK